MELRIGEGKAKFEMNKFRILILENLSIQSLFYQIRIIKSLRSSLNFGGVLSDSFSSFRNCMLGELTREEKLTCGLNFASAKSLLLAVLGDTTRFSRQFFENIVDEGGHNHH